jgi:hypothetical protein
MLKVALKFGEDYTEEVDQTPEKCLDMETTQDFFEAEGSHG